MQRRRLLIAAGGLGVAGVVGLLATDDSPESRTPAPTPTETPAPADAATRAATRTETTDPTEAPTDTPAETATPENPHFEITELKLLDEWSGPGDIHNRPHMTEVRPGAIVFGAARVRLPVRDGRIAATAQFTVRRGLRTVAEAQTRVDRLVTSEHVAAWEPAAQLSTGDWDDREHVLEVVVRDDTGEDVPRRSASIPFDVLEAA